MLIRLKNLFLLIILTFFIGCSLNKENPLESVSAGRTTPNSPFPENNAGSQSLSLNFNWIADSSAVYDFYLDQTNPPRTVYQKDIVSKPIFVSGLDYGKTYYWQVVSKYSDGTLLEGPIWEFTTLNESFIDNGFVNGYALFLDYVQTNSPNQVKVLFHVQDLKGNGITNLFADNYIIYEDSQPLSVSEAELQINKVDGIPFTIKTVLMLDNSASLQTNIDQIRDVALNFINNLQPNEEIAVYKFSDKIKLLNDFSSDKNILAAALNNYVMGTESTDFYGAVKTGTSLVNDYFGPDQIIRGALVIVTDGKDTQGSNTLAQAVNAVNNKIVFSVGLGDEIQTEILEKIGTAGFFNVADVGILEAKFDTLRQKIFGLANSYYLLNYHSPKRGNYNHTITITVKDNAHNGDNSFITGIYSSNGFL